MIASPHTIIIIPQLINMDIVGFQVARRKHPKAPGLGSLPSMLRVQTSTPKRTKRI